MKILHPEGPPGDEEFDEYVAYAVEGRRRVKEQMNKRKPDEEFARIQLSYFDREGREIIVTCPESRHAVATQSPARRDLHGKVVPQHRQIPEPVEPVPSAVQEPVRTEKAIPKPQERHFTIFYGDTGYSYENIFGPYLPGAKVIVVEDPYIRRPYQIQNFVRLCETVVKLSNIKRIELVTGYDDLTQKAEIEQKLGELQQSLLEMDIVFEFEFNPNLHDREIRLDNGWVIKIGRGLDFYQKPNSWYEIGTNDLSLRKCLETRVDTYLQ